MRRQRTPKPKKTAIIGLSTVIVALLIVVGILVLNNVGKQSEQASDTTQTSSSHSEKKTTLQVAQSSKSSQSSTDDAATTSSQSQSTASSSADSVLADFSQSACEDPNTRTNGGDVTYSQFYYDDDDQSWHWSFSSSKRGQVEDAVVTNVTAGQQNNQVRLTSGKYETGTQYTATLTWLNDDHTKYNFHTSFKSINGDYTIGADAYTDYSQVNDTGSVGDSFDAWLNDNVSGREKELVETRTNGGEVTYSTFEKYGDTWYWTLSSDARGVIAEAVITSGQVTNHGDLAVLTAQSIAYPSYDKKFQLNVNFVDSTTYQVTTAFESINGKYSSVD